MVSEMVSADGLSRGSPKTHTYQNFRPLERPFGIQLFGSDPTVMAKAAEAAIGSEPDFIDINMGCPVRKVIKREAGGALMKNPILASSIVKAVRSAIGNSCLLTVKFRSGWDHANLNYADFGLMMENAGADAVCLHPRTVKQLFAGSSNWQHIYELKRRMSIPVIGNGDITTVELALSMFRDTLCDSIMIGRRAVGRPWIFSQIKCALAQEELLPITPAVMLQTILDHIDLALIDDPPQKVVREMKAHLCQYTEGLIGSAVLRDKLNHCSSISEMKDLLRNHLV